MQEPTEREKRLLGYLKVMINFMTIWGIYESRVKSLRDWAFDTMNASGASMEWQNEMLHYLEEEFAMKYTKLDSNGEPLKGNDGDKAD